MDPLLEAILDNTKNEVKEEVEDEDTGRETGGSANARDPDERSEGSSLESSPEQTWAEEDSHSDGVSEEEEARSNRKRTAKAKKGGP
ncbi:hypothetical protein AAVH_40186 [Aphelenchoides avenae]|nr:hypothetical protein AAVH_40186 [Aphelenchus avenae]